MDLEATPRLQLAQPAEDLCRKIPELIESCQGKATPQRLFDIVQMVSESLLRKSRSPWLQAALRHAV